MSAVGYRQIGSFLRGEDTLDNAMAEIRRATRQFVRRQANWFKMDDPAIHWVPASPRAASQLGAWLSARLNDRRV